MNTTEFHPDFVRRLNNESFPGAELLDALNGEVPVSIRFNPLKARPDLPIKSEVGWCSHAHYLRERPSFTMDPLFHAGAYYPQEAGSMVIDKVLNQLDLPDDPTILDLCGAPGGKSTLILSYLNNSGLLVSNDVIQTRAKILKENCTKWGFSNSIVTNNDPADFDRLPDFFDVLLVDAPCSGEGMFRKDPEARKEWSEDNVKLCAARQKRILADIWGSLKPGGYLLYSTCTFNQSENEANVLWLQNELGAKYIKCEFPEKFQEGREGVGYYAIPGKIDAEGFYIAILQKVETSSSSGRQDGRGKGGKTKTKHRGLTKEKDLSLLKEYVNGESNTVWRWNEYLLALPENTEELALSVYSNMRIVKLGTELGTIARKGFVPSHDLSMNPNLRKSEHTLDLSKEEALRYLKGETFPLDGKQGIHLVSYQNEPLGWIKHLGNRFNNGYPKEWRIKMKLK